MHVFGEGGNKSLITPCCVPLYQPDQNCGKRTPRYDNYSYINVMTDKLSSQHMKGKKHGLEPSLCQKI